MGRYILNMTDRTRLQSSESSDSRFRSKMRLYSVSSRGYLFKKSSVFRSLNRRPVSCWHTKATCLLFLERLSDVRCCVLPEMQIHARSRSPYGHRFPFSNIKIPTRNNVKSCRGMSKIWHCNHKSPGYSRNLGDDLGSDGYAHDSHVCSASLPQLVGP